MFEAWKKLAAKDVKTKIAHLGDKTLLEYIVCVGRLAVEVNAPQWIVATMLVSKIGWAYGRKMMTETTYGQDKTEKELKEELLCTDDVWSARFVENNESSTDAQKFISPLLLHQNVFEALLSAVDKDYQKFLREIEGQRKRLAEFSELLKSDARRLDFVMSEIDTLSGCCALKDLATRAIPPTDISIDTLNEFIDFFNFTSTNADATTTKDETTEDTSQSCWMNEAAEMFTEKFKFLPFTV